MIWKKVSYVSWSKLSLTSKPNRLFRDPSIDVNKNLIFKVKDWPQGEGQGQGLTRKDHTTEICMHNAKKIFHID